MNLLIQNAYLVDEGGARAGEIYIKDGRIAPPEGKYGAGCKVIDAGGLTLMPAFIDMHSHFRDPGFPQKETVETGSRAAAAGGYTAVNTMANTNPVCSSLKQAEYVRRKAEEAGLIEVHQCVSVTENFDGHTTSHLEKLDGSVRLISEDGKGVQSNHTMGQAMRIAREKGLVILSHAEDMEISPYDYRLAENIATARDIYLSEYYGARLHMCHVSTKEAMAAVIEAKKRGVPVTCEVAPHHLWFYGSGYRVNPPIREKSDVDFLVQAVKDGWVDMIATDHAPHTEEDKKNGSPGMVGLETAFPVCYTRLVKSGEITLSDLSRMLSRNPARMLGLNKGLLEPGFDGDVVLVDTARAFVVDPEKLHSKSRNTPFGGERLFGEICLTVHKGAVTYEKE
ncbi:MAG: dihydroorotase [Oscillospiraceae bacterium]|nr:dihydroorotase [Oscillospiraceae bacterium]